jgi:nucleotide-binding universal stress UspA family protein
MKTILAALDGSPRAPGVLATAIAVARAQGSRLVLLRTIGVPGEIPKDLWQSTDAPLADVLERRAADYLQTCEAQVPSELRVECRVVVGSPWEAICKTAGSLEAELVIVGSHGYGGIDRLIGTTAAKVVNHCACSVLVVKEPKSAGAASGHEPS